MTVAEFGAGGGSGRAASFEAMTAGFDALWRRTEALTALYHVLDPQAPLPPLGDWAIDPPAAVLLVNLTTDRRPELIVECGCGTSTVIFGLALRRLGLAGSARIIAFEHDPLYAEVTRANLRRHGLAHVATVVDAPLADTAHGRWYDADVVASTLAAEAPIELLFIDGPPAADDALVRGRALGHLYDRLAPDAVVAVDDAFRDGEREWVADAPGTWPDLRFVTHWTQNGTAVAHRGAD